VAYSLPSTLSGSVSNDTSLFYNYYLPSGAQCVAGNTFVFSGAAPQQYFVWQSPASMSGTLEVDTCQQPGFSTRLFVLTECPSHPTVTSNILVTVSTVSK
jgi:hypothetical protein